MSKEELKAEIKRYLYGSVAHIEDDSKSYWYIYQVAVEILIELLHAGFPNKEDRIKIIRETCEGVVKHIREVEDVEKNEV